MRTFVGYMAGLLKCTQKINGVGPVGYNPIAFANLERAYVLEATALMYGGPHDAISFGGGIIRVSRIL